MWECGLKLNSDTKIQKVIVVTPYVGVWIETKLNNKLQKRFVVTPYVGVWIETFFLVYSYYFPGVTPYVGVWIETEIVKLDISELLSHSLCGSVD